ncbi:hypothetical protein A3850_010320 [Lewinella sp. 4G2]|nr:hypothetical protein A3850_010320 [Lewinella sp. 4G2]
MLLGGAILGQQEMGVEKALRRTYEKGNLLSAISSMRWKTGVTLAGASLNVGEYRDLRIQLAGGRAYTLYASAETERAYLDLQLLDADGQLLVVDAGDDATPFLEFTAPSDGPYVLRAYLRSSDLPRLGVGIGLMDTDGFTLPRSRYDFVAKKFFGSLAGLRTAAPNVRLDDTTPNWPVLVAFAVPENELQIDGIVTFPGDYLFALSSAPDAPDQELYLLNDVGAVEGRSNTPGQAPLIEKRLQKGTYSLRIHRENNTLPNILFLGILLR